MFVIQVRQKDFLKALERLQWVVPRKGNSLPELDNVMMETIYPDVLHMVTTNLNVTMSTWMSVERPVVDTDPDYRKRATIFVRFWSLYDVVKIAGDHLLRCDVSPDGSTLRVNNGRSVYNVHINNVDTENSVWWETNAKFKKTFVFDAKLFATALWRASQFTARDAFRPALQGVLIAGTNRKAGMVSTNGHILYHGTLTTSLDSGSRFPKNFIIPASFIKKTFTRQIAEGHTVRIHIREGDIVEVNSVDQYGHVFYSWSFCLDDGLKFPHYPSVIPKTLKTDPMLLVDSKDLHTGVKKACQIARNQGSPEAYMFMRDTGITGANGLDIAAKDGDTGLSLRTWVGGSYTGSDALLLAFNPRYMDTLIKCVDDEQVKLILHDPQEFTHITPWVDVFGGTAIDAPKITTKSAIKVVEPHPQSGLSQLFLIMPVRID